MSAEKSFQVEHVHVVKGDRPRFGSISRAAVCGSFFLLVLLATFYRLNQGHYIQQQATLSSVRTSSLTRRAIVPTVPTPLLRNFQVIPPVLTPFDDGVRTLTDESAGGVTRFVNLAEEARAKRVVLMEHVFEFSFGSPYIGTYKPPTCRFNRVTLNLTVTSTGRQFDRLGTIYMGDTEIWRTSTAEPTKTGIIWTYVKDMSNYLALFQQQNKLIFDLENLVDSTYTGTYNATLTATFFTSKETVEPADVIIPISARLASQNRSSDFTVPSQNASNSVTLPQRTRKAVVTIAATGQIGEEFWYTNVLNSNVNTFGAGFLYGSSPFREVQLYIDGCLAGLVWPFPVIFTGGVVPGLWRPIVGIDAFDVREDEIDVTPWLPLLCDGKSHTFEIRVAGIDDDGQGHGRIANSGGEFWTGSQYWVVTGKIFLWLDPAGSVTNGSSIISMLPTPIITLTSAIGVDVNGTNETLTYSVNVGRYLSISSTITTANGTFLTTWQQSLNYSNQGFYTDYGHTDLQIQSTNGVDKSSGGYSREISYPILLNTSFAKGGNDTYIRGHIERGQSISVTGVSVFPSGLQAFDVLLAVQGSHQTFQGSNLMTTQNGTAYYYSNGTLSSSFGTTEQNMLFEGVQVVVASSEYEYPASTSTELYHRYVKAVNTTVVEDDETLIGKNIFSCTTAAAQAEETTFAPDILQTVLGRR